MSETLSLENVRRVVREELAGHEAMRRALKVIRTLAAFDRDCPATNDVLALVPDDVIYLCDKALEESK